MRPAISRSKCITWAAIIGLTGVLYQLVGGTCTPSRHLTSPPLYIPDSLPSKIDASQSVFLEELTWVEVRDRIKTGITRAIIATGGIEQSGPYVVLNKHDQIVKAIAERAARELGSTFVAPIISFVPEGGITPPTGHMTFPGTISLRASTFESLLIDIATSLVQHGITEVILIGDSGDSQTGMREAALQAQKLVDGKGTVRFLPDYYNYSKVRDVIKDSGISESPEPFHDELAFSLQLLALNPNSVRLAERIKAGLASTGGYRLDTEEARALGEKILSFRTFRLVDDIRKSGAREHS